MEPKTIVAIEIASSKIKGAAGSVGPDGRITVLAVEEIAGLNNVRYGRVQNIREVSAAVNEIIRRLENAPGVKPRKVRALAVALGGRSLSGAPAQAAQKFPKECEITERQVERLAFEATHDFMGDKNIEATVPRIFYVNNAAVRRPVGTFGESFRGEFVMITCGKETRQNLDRIKYDTIDPAKVTYIIRPTAVADLVLTPDEKELGTALVDIGAETTTVAVYKEGTLAFVCTIPMGARLITYDLTTGFNITEEAAEAMKIAFAAKAEIADAELVTAYVNSRAGEIAANVLAQLNAAGYNAQTLTKIVLTGGGANIAAFGNQLMAQGKLPTRVADMPRDIAFRVAGRNSADNIDIIALLVAGARKIEDSCLSPLAPPAPPVTVFEDPAEEDEVPVAETGTTETPQQRQEQRQEQRQTEIYTPAQGTGRRRNIDEDDPDLYNDDPDVDAQPETAKSRYGFPFFGRRKNKGHADLEQHHRRPEQPVYTDPDDEDPFGASEVEPEEPYEGGSSSTERAGAAINNLRDKICKLFQPQSVEEEEDADADE